MKQFHRNIKFVRRFLLYSIAFALVTQTISFFSRPTHESGHTDTFFTWGSAAHADTPHFNHGSGDGDSNDSGADGACDSSDSSGAGGGACGPA